ncbi:hypothetical protein FOL47_000910 [Perkinsus chesapeaki]|uniref:Uncharacterized protein n=1 Tax=Perkinsus chesapeaki TaxID=330153 RepID=A0A7J6N0V9_PERCH|nr:hypothetical protein FOL47_000910 [Perkinsus chesapeaki]
MFHSPPVFNTRISRKVRVDATGGSRPLGGSLSPSKVLEKVYGRFAGPHGMSGTQWAKMCYQAGLADAQGAPLASVDADLVFVDVQRRELSVKGGKLPYEVFAQQAIPSLAQKAGLTVHKIIERLDALPDTLAASTRSSITASRMEESLMERRMSGPERLYYRHLERRSSNGTERKSFRRRSPVATLRSQPSSGSIDLSQICDRTDADVRGTKKQQKQYAGGMTTHAARVSDRLSQSTRSLRSLDRQMSSTSVASFQSEGDLVGPERFFYDKKTYTGTARRSIGSVKRYNSVGVLAKRNSLDGIAEATDEEELRAMLTGRDKPQLSPNKAGNGRPPQRAMLSNASSVTVLPPATRMEPPTQPGRIIMAAPSRATLVAPTPFVPYSVPTQPSYGSFTPFQPTLPFGQPMPVLQQQRRLSGSYSAAAPLHFAPPSGLASGMPMFALSSPLGFQPPSRV